MRPATRTAATIITTIGLALLAAACGSSPSSAGSAGSPNTGGPAASQQVAFARCVRAHGVPNFPDPDSSGKFSKQALQQLGVSKSRLRAAINPCSHLLPGQAPITVQDQQDYLKAASCMRSHGIAEFPDPTFSSGSASFTMPTPGVNTSSPQFTRAEQICRRLIPAGLPYSASGGGS
jgi:hypothetical protein